MSDRDQTALRAEISTMLRQRADELREAVLHGHDREHDDRTETNLAAARELEAMAVRVDAEESYEAFSEAVMVRELTKLRQRIEELEAGLPGPGPLFDQMREAASIVCHRIAQHGAGSPQARFAHQMWAAAWGRWRGSSEAEGS